MARERERERTKKKKRDQYCVSKEKNHRPVELILSEFILLLIAVTHISILTDHHYCIHFYANSAKVWTIQPMSKRCDVWEKNFSNCLPVKTLSVEIRQVRNLHSNNEKVWCSWFSSIVDKKIGLNECHEELSNLLADADVNCSSVKLESWIQVFNYSIIQVLDPPVEPLSPSPSPSSFQRNSSS
jgi:hypothetical protein